MKSLLLVYEVPEGLLKSLKSLIFLSFLIVFLILIGPLILSEEKKKSQGDITCLFGLIVLFHGLMGTLLASILITKNRRAFTPSIHLQA
ncbi:hypothetical protein B0H65DRAFT_74690 [Neurospora tetraspora]|uniref:Uncharacterized protein n=1 Tax=Neurospora tetraspora TaxID=94610 RepID=A0AAE0MJZ8_9PEZI|nr:hypothetical protein B0H65DRAFT_74690 [Neurospora tetraspora]